MQIDCQSRRRSAKPLSPLDVLLACHALKILLIKKIIFFLQPLLPPFQHCLFSPETLWPFPVFLWYCICTSISLFPVSHLILKTNKQTIKNNTLKEKKWCLCTVWSKDSHQIVATVLICNSPNFIGKVFYLHNNHPFFFLPAMALYKQEKNQIRQTSDHYVSLSDK